MSTLLCTWKGVHKDANILKSRVHLATRLRLQAFQISPGRKFLRDLKKGTVDQVCLITNKKVAVMNEEHMKRPQSTEPKSAREE